MTRASTSAVCGVVLLLAQVALAAAPPPRHVSQDAAGRLVYLSDERGNRVPDFSHCGYMGGGVAIPTAPVRVIITPVAGDSTARIQAAIDHVAKLPADDSGLRGAVLLLMGRHEVAGALSIRVSGIVLRGEGFGPDGTTLVATGVDRRTLLTIAGHNNRHVDAAVEIADEYVPVNATRFRVNNHGLKVGQSVVIRRPCTAEWIAALGMDRFGGDRHGGGWKPGSRQIVWDRSVTAIDGDHVTLDVPLTTSLDKAFGGGTIAAYTFAGRISHVGVENLRLESACDASKPLDEDHAWMAITMDNVEDAWVRQMAMAHFAGSAVALLDGARRVTVEDCKSIAPVSENAGSRRNAFFTSAQQTLIQRCWSESGRHDFSVGFCAAGPNAFVQCFASGALDESGPIDSWASGVLYDNVRIDGNELNLHDRKYRAQQAGWAAANSVLWQCSAAVINCSSPPGATNWTYGCWGQFSGNGAFASSRETIKPASLYYAQLSDRLGSNAKTQPHLMLVETDASSSPTLEQAAALTASSQRPAPRLDEWIDDAPRREPIASDRANARNIDELWSPAPAAPPSAKRAIELRNGRLTRDGAVVTGGQQHITWWAGGVRPADVEAAKAKAPNITRFVPGRTGRGLTDDLDELTDSMIAGHFAALVHHHGLWYDTRSADHERVRRKDGDVWPPFYEQPFLRSGTGVAWDGLSRYDLMRYNPWYWNRLKAFADLCDQKGLLLINEHYFQHNILEAGAHWSSFPWRPVNNTNDTGFPEPPPYAGDKRIFMAEQFYDVTHPVRTPIHRAFIRKNLDAFADNSNVIHFTSGEFTGPLSFVEFWLDTIAEWQKETGKRPLIGLSCTKDVQDAILADPQRSRIVDVIDIRYWWYQRDGTLYAPRGGQNLAPRQHARLHKPRPTSAEQVERAVREYREKYPKKAAIFSADGAEQFGEAIRSAGGSLAPLPQPSL